MNRCTSSFAILAFGTFCTSSTIAMAAHSTICSAPDKSVAIVVLATPGSRATSLSTTKWGNHISNLIWETGAPGSDHRAKGRGVEQLDHFSNAVFGFSGNSHMEDCDWLKDAPSFAARDWSHQSIHPALALTDTSTLTSQQAQTS
ncbi:MULTISPECIES: omptin family outer membrane protease [Mesorhizobium]|uniref:omptin family outer membrane protease n=1 Tax=Mesorhizobium TaxID=68287 RepID=UPI0011410C8A|nr:MULTISPECIES: omptin family outer membrane protease [Mesorhizobium]